MVFCFSIWNRFDLKRTKIDSSHLNGYIVRALVGLRDLWFIFSWFIRTSAGMWIRSPKCLTWFCFFNHPNMLNAHSTNFQWNECIFHPAIIFSLSLYVCVSIEYIVERFYCCCCYSKLTIHFIFPTVVAFMHFMQKFKWIKTEWFKILL